VDVDPDLIARLGFDESDGASDGASDDDVAMRMDELGWDVDVAVVSGTVIGADDNNAAVGELEDGFVLSISETVAGDDADDADDAEETTPSKSSTLATPYDCPICMETLDEDTDGVVKLGCSHKFCPGCFVKHMRCANKCAMCRAKVCAKPKPKHMGAQERFDVVSGLVWHGNMVSDIHGRIMTDARKNLIAASGNVDTKYVSETMVRIKDFVREEDIRKATIVSSFLVADRMSEWYDDESSSRIAVTWGGERFDIS
jgi:hypothetical protein